ncbi:MAG: 3-oxoacyl-ACP reductase [Nevskiales bacterium]|nr:3-oxoacyl-ACP reductase [Nevskiales bacterium]
MSNRYLQMSQTLWGKSFISLLGLPQPPRLKRGEGPWVRQPLEGQTVILGGSTGARFVNPLLEALDQAGAHLQVRSEPPRVQASTAAVEPAAAAPDRGPSGGEGPPSQALVYDASGFSRPEQLRELYDFFQPLISGLSPNGRVLVIAASETDVSPVATACSYALHGFIRSLGKEIGRKGACANLLVMKPGAGPALAGAVRYFLSDRSAFISGQSLLLQAPAHPPWFEWQGTLKGKVALVTGAARGIGAAIAEVLAREGAQIVGVDRPREQEALSAVLNPIQGVGLPEDITAADAPARILQECRSHFGGLDIVVHNAGITRDRLLRNMQPGFWDKVIEVNLAAMVRLNEALLKGGLKPGARLVCVSSIGGIAGNVGQTHYAATKSAVIGYVKALAPALALQGGAINAVAPGFIETQMSAAMPLIPRVVGRLMNSMLQGGLPVDVAEAVAFLSSPYAAGINGQTLRVCGQHLVGA